MFKKILIVAAVLLAALVFTGCPGVLNSDLPSDMMISLGVFSPAEGISSVRTAVAGKIYVPVYINDQHSNSSEGSYEVSFTISSDYDLSTEGDNIAAGTRSIAAGSETVIELDVPAGTPVADPVPIYLFASFEAAVGDPAVEINGKLLNISVVQLIVGATNEADLEISFINPPSVYRAAGSVFPIWFKIINAGNKVLVEGTTIPVSFEVNINGTDTEFGTSSVVLASALYPNAFVTGTADITMPIIAQMAADEIVDPADVDDWTDQLWGRVDPDDVIPEVVEGGSDSFWLDSGTEQPDLWISAVDLPGYALAGGAVEAAVTIGNNGYAVAAANAYSVVLYYDTVADGEYIAADDTVLHTWAAASCPAVPWDADNSGNGNEIVLYVGADDGSVYPASMTEGSYEIGAAVTGSITEWDDEPDTGTVNLDIVSKDIDLEISYISTSLTQSLVEADGGTVPVSVTIKNSGSDTVTTDFTISFYASPNAGLNPAGGDSSLGSTTVTEDLAPGKKLVTYDAIFPGGEGGGFYTVYAVVDSGDAVAETDEDNNIPEGPSDSPAFIVVDDGGNLNARILVCLPNKATANDSYTQYFRYYETLWTQIADISWGNNYYSGPYIYGVMNISLPYDEDHGVRLYSDADNTSCTWRIVPSYVDDINTVYIPNALRSDDGFENNDSIGDAAVLSGSSNPLFSWVSSYDSQSYDYDYYEFHF